MSFCLLGVAQPSDLIQNVHITPFNIGYRIELTDFTEIEAQPLLEGLDSKSENSKEAKAVLHRVLYWTGGHPYLTQRLCDTVRRLERSITPRDVDVASEELFLSSRSREKEDNLIFVRERVLASDEHRAAILDLYEKVLRGVRVRDDDSNKMVDPLRLSGLLIVSDGYLKVRNRIYGTVFDRKWITRNMPDAEVRRQKAAYRRGILSAVAIALPVLSVIIALVHVTREAEQDDVRRAFSSAVDSGQEAINVGDYATARSIISLWYPETADHRGMTKPERYMWNVREWTRDVWEARGSLETSFPMRLLRGEANGESRKLISRQGTNQANHTGCATKAETAVATTLFQGRPLIAAAGEDSSIQIWYSDSPTPTPLPHGQLQLTAGKNEAGKDILNISHTLKSCKEVIQDSSTLPGIMSLSFSPDGSKLAIATGSWRNALSPGFVLLWDMKELDSVVTQGTFPKTTDWVQFSNDGKYLAASSEDATAQIWNISGRTPSEPRLIEPSKINLQGVPRVGGSGAHVVAL